MESKFRGEIRRDHLDWGCGGFLLHSRSLEDVDVVNKRHIGTGSVHRNCIELMKVVQRGAHASLFGRDYVYLLTHFTVCDFIHFQFHQSVNQMG